MDKSLILELLIAVNTFVNSHVSYAPEKVDYWATPEETVSSGQGDCEDYAILKRAMLKELGVTSKMAYVRSKEGAHMVLISEGLVLDNFVDDVSSLEKREDIKVVASFDEDQLDIGGLPSNSKAEDLFPQFFRVKEAKAPMSKMGFVFQAK